MLKHKVEHGDSKHNFRLWWIEQHTVQKHITCKCFKKQTHQSCWQDWGQSSTACSSEKPTFLLIQFTVSVLSCSTSVSSRDITLSPWLYCLNARSTCCAWGEPVFALRLFELRWQPIGSTQLSVLLMSTSVLLFSKLNKIFFGYFYPENVFLDNKNK